MLFILLSILSSTAIVLLFKLFRKFQIDTFQAIVFNYLTCVFLGWAALGSFPIQLSSATEIWFPYAMVLGFLFIVSFNIAAVTVQYFGVTLAAIMQRMSLLISVPFAVFSHGESADWFKIIGLFFALLAIIFATLSNAQSGNQKNKIPKVFWLLPVLILICGGLNEIVLLHVKHIAAADSNLSFVTFIFATAAIIGTIRLAIMAIRRQSILHKKHAIAGIVLGLFNFGSVYFLLQALDAGWDGSVAFPLNNVAVIALSSGIAWLVLREKLSKVNILGVAMSVLAIVLIALS